MESRQVAALVEQADRARRAHNWNTAIDLLKRALAIDPEHDGAHASLALALLGARRLTGAAI
ncbi:MAG TPA: tetratricopeptide repeat protein, partial [Kofleriaceae bacterium]